MTVFEDGATKKGIKVAWGHQDWSLNPTGLELQMKGHEGVCACPLSVLCMSRRKAMGDTERRQPLRVGESPHQNGIGQHLQSPEL